MKSDIIKMDDTPRSIIHRYFYPISYVQIFQSCDWVDIKTFMLEGEEFKNIFVERSKWLKDQNIKCLMYYRAVVTEDHPTVYHLITEFKRADQADSYRARWLND